ncbi:Exosome complex component RRP41 [Halotydeus destructor]|nr:Exosome complex component RRP41 [Halotydeus destructor]
MELLSDEGFRTDGRRPDELREVTCRLGVFEQADGSAYVEIGNSRVLAAVYGPHEVRSGSKARPIHDRAFINCQFSQAVFSTSSRKQRQRGDFKALEITAVIKDVYETSILTQTYPHSQIDIYLEVLQADGGILAACINASSLALIHAGIAMKDIVVASSAGFIGDNPIMDVNYIEEGVSSSPVFTLAMLAKSKEILSLESTGRLNLDNLTLIQTTAMEACDKMHSIMREAILDHLQEC